VKGPRAPGAAEWLAALACSALIAAETQTQGERQRLQSATSYYFDAPYVPLLHTVSLVVDVLMVALPLAWLATSYKSLAQKALYYVAAFGLLLAWGEVLYALRLQEGAVYQLGQLPFRPINNLGVIGAQVFATYLILNSPAGRLTGWRAFLVKCALALGFWYFQAIVWQMAAAA
jgi:hypothetical protein